MTGTRDRHSSHYRRIGFDIRKDQERVRDRPWANVQLTKAERKGKTPAEIDELRKIKWGRDEGGAPATVIDTSVKDCSQEDK